MSTTVTTNRIGARQILAILALICFILAAFAFHGTFTEWSGSVLLAIGLALFVASTAVWF